jgi:hypothetical protein
MKLLTQCALAAILALTVNNLGAQEAEQNKDFNKDFEIKEIKIETLKVPSGSSKDSTLTTFFNPARPYQGASMEWAVVLVKFIADPTDKETKDTLLGKQPNTILPKTIQVKIHLLTPEPKGKDMFEQQHLSLTLDYGPVFTTSQAMVTAAFLPPTVVELLGGSSNMKAGSNAAAQIFFNGKEQFALELKTSGKRAGKENWYTEAGKENVLVPLSKTPWVLDFPDKLYPELDKDQVAAIEAIMAAAPEGN